MEPRKQAIVNALRAFVRQRPGMDPRNYNPAGYRSESRQVTRDRHHAEALLSAVAARDGITADMLVKASESAYSGRLTIDDESDHNTLPYRIDYCTGQYFPTEYRKAVAAVCASALWYYVREHEMPAPTYKQHGSASYLPMRTEALHEGKTPGDWLRAYFRREFGRTIAERYFR